MTTLLQAVGTDTYGGLSGYKRPTQGNPTRVPSNQPAFRGVSNKPGSNIRAPAIKSSANRNNRGTNVQIPYMRETLINPVGDVGRLKMGDVAFVSKTRPDIPGYAHARHTQLLGVDALNRFMGPDYWDTKTSGGKYRYILVDSDRPADDWRSVPTFQEWSVDGIVLSNEGKETFYNYSEYKRDNQVYNIAVQGPTTVNNGFAEEVQGWDEIARIQQGLASQAPRIYSSGYMDHRVEKFGPGGPMDPTGQKFDFRADYQGPNYHLYPLQMFDRDICVQAELYVGLVCTEYTIDAVDTAVLTEYQAAVNALAQAQADEDAAAIAVNERALAAFQSEERMQKAFRAKSAFEKMGWYDDTTKAVKAEEGVPKKSFCAFRYVLFTSSQALELDADPMVLPGTALRKRQKLDRNSFDDATQREQDLRNMVGAWHIGSVMDIKAATMPGNSGGPVDTGYRVTVNVNIGWCDWRALRRKYTPKGIDKQIGDKLPGADSWPANLSKLQPLAEGTMFYWPTVYQSERVADDAERAKNIKINAPVNPEYNMKAQQEAVFQGVPAATLDPNIPANAAESGNPSLVVDPQQEPRRVAQQINVPDASDTGPRDLPEQDNPNRLDDPNRPEGPVTDAAIRNKRLAQMTVRPALADARDSSALLQHASIAVANLKLLLAPITAGEVRAHKAGQALPTMASFVMAPTAPPASRKAPAAAAASAAPPAPAASLRRRSGNTPDPSPDRTGSVAPTSAAAAPVAAPTSAAAAASSLPPVIEAPSAPAAPASAAQRKRRQAATSEDVFSSIFGGGDSSGTMQPLNPAHRSDGGGTASGAASGRSYQRRGKGSGSKD